MKHYFYLGDDADLPYSPHDSNRDITLVSGFSLRRFLDQNLTQPFDLLILCGAVEDNMLKGWVTALSDEPNLPPVVLLSEKEEHHKRLFSDRTDLFVLRKSPVIETMWNDLALAEETFDTAREEGGDAVDFLGIIGISPAVTTLRRQIRKYAKSHASVLILGESGTGKELTARALHRLGSPEEAPFLDYQRSPVGEDLFESDLFGVRKGAYTGAVTRKGLMETAHGGTLFIDEIGTLSAGNQISLLRVLDERKVRPLGDNNRVDVNFRLITATNELFPDAVVEGRFREDLFHRISTLIIRIPPLRERKEDIPLLADYFLAQMGEAKRFSTRSLVLLKRHEWPGNIRELSNTVERASVESGERQTIETRDIIFN